MLYSYLAVEKLWKDKKHIKILTHMIRKIGEKQSYVQKK